MGPSGRFTHVVIILDCLGHVHTGVVVFRGLTDSQRTPGLGRHSLVSELRYTNT